MFTFRTIDWQCNQQLLGVLCLHLVWGLHYLRCHYCLKRHSLPLLMCKCCAGHMQQRLQQGLSESLYKRLSSAHHLPFVSPMACSDTILAFDNCLSNFFCSRITVSLSFTGQSSHVFKGYAESPTISGRMTVPLRSIVGSIKTFSFSAVSNISLSLQTHVSCKLPGYPVENDK